MRQALGKGLDALIRQAQEAPKTDAGAVKKIPVGKIRPNRYQPRKVFNDDSLQELSQSIKQHGLAQPITVTYDARADRYELITGERRFRASQLAGVKQIDAVVYPEMDGERTLALSLIENIQREDLNPLDTALAFRELVDKFKIAQTQLAAYCGKSKAAISNSLRLLELEPEIQKALQSGAITEGHARALLTVADKTKRRRLFHAAVEYKMSVRELEEAAREFYDKEPSPRRRGNKSPDIVAFESNIQRAIGTKVEIKPGSKPNTGKLVIQYCSLDDLERVAGKLTK